MNFARYFKISSYCLISTGFVSVVATRRIHPVWIILFAAIFVASWRMNTVRLRQRIPSWILNCLALAYVPFFVWDARLISRSLVSAAIHLLIFAAAVKLLTLSKDRDYLQLYLISLAEILAASTQTVNMVFGICLLAFITSGTSTLVLFEMRRSNAKMQGATKVQPFVRGRGIQETDLELFSPFPAGLFFLSTVGMTLLILAAAVPLFLLLPRLSTGFYGRPSGNTQFVSGFSDRVELGRFGSIRQSSAVVMRVQTAAPPSQTPENLKWRGLSFDHFDGRSWKNTERHRVAVSTQGRYYKLENSAQGTNWLNQTFFVEALSTNVIFAASRVLAVSLDVGHLERDPAGNLYTDLHVLKKLRYAAISDATRPNPGNISDLIPIPQEILTRYLQLPPEDSRVLDLARRATRTSKDRYAKAIALERYLRSNYRYSFLLRGTPNSKDPLAMFLFDVRAGHCEYFASSMTIMLRQLGIPARLVNGFRTGEFNSIGNNWTVRQHHAHSWVEAYFPPYGWIEFDPTPADPGQPKTGFVHLLSDLTDAIDLWWWEGVINYDSSKQYRVLSVTYAALDTCRHRVADFFVHAYEKGSVPIPIAQTRSIASAFGKGWMVWAVLIPLVALLLIRRWRRRILGRIQRAWHRDNSRALAASFFGEALELLGDRGFKRNRGQTALEFAGSLKGKPPGKPFLALTQLYYEMRFGPPDLPFNGAEAQTQLRLLRNSLGACSDNRSDCVPGGAGTDARRRIS
jgi:protein-glutamine gamma-glutamyltransferase